MGDSADPGTIPVHTGERTAHKHKHVRRKGEDEPTYEMGAAPRAPKRLRVRQRAQQAQMNCSDMTNVPPVVGMIKME
eukprot:scaffold319464_cov32-Tisochrysis_lutea.AAC.1